jgi:hypothetical protein
VALSGIFKWLTGGSQNGPFSWLIRIVEERARTKRAETLQAHAVDVLGHLRDGTVYREITPDGSIEIWAPPAQTAHISATLEYQLQEPSPGEPSEVQGQQPKALGRSDLPLVRDPFAGPGVS